MKILLAIIVSAALDSSYMAIGDQMDLRLQATYEQTEPPVSLPLYAETLVPGIEIVNRTIVDTTRLDNGQVQLTQYLTLTSFKDSLFYINPIPFVSGADTFYSEALTLNIIQPFDIDTANAITDIKPIESAPHWFWGWFRWVLLALGLLALAAGVYFLITWLRRRLHNDQEPVNPELLRPAEEVALEKLNKIRDEKIWQTGQFKQYHTELTDVIREYIGRRFDIRSIEKTSDETLLALKPLMKDQTDLYRQLNDMLRLADLVKFAKWTTTPLENEQALNTAYDFVHTTTPKPAEEGGEV